MALEETLGRAGTAARVYPLAFRCGPRVVHDPDGCAVRSGGGGPVRASGHCRRLSATLYQMCEIEPAVDLVGVCACGTEKGDQAGIKTYAAYGCIFGRGKLGLERHGVVKCRIVEFVNVWV